MTSMYVELRAGEVVKFDGPATVTLMEKSGQRARLNIQAGEDVKVELPNHGGAVQARLGIKAPG